MIIAGLRALAVVGEGRWIDEQLGSKILKNGFWKRILGLQTESRVPHQCYMRCKAKAVCRPIAPTSQFHVFGRESIVPDDRRFVSGRIEQTLAFASSQQSSSRHFVLPWSRTGQVTGKSGKLRISNLNGS